MIDVSSVSLTEHNDEPYKLSRKVKKTINH